MGKRALVTGAAGFVGRHMTNHLHSQGWDVARCDIVGPMAWTMHDFNDVTRWNDIRYDIVVHCAAVGAHRAAIDGQPHTFAKNMRLDAALFDWAIKTKQRRVIYISSSAAYPIEYQNILGGDHEMRLEEDMIDLWHPRLADGTYGVTKLTGEHLARAARAAGVPVTVVRPFSGYGEDQGPDWPFGAFVQRIGAGFGQSSTNPFVIWGSMKQRRDWIHIDDVIHGMLAIAESKTEDPVNLCTGVPTSMKDLVMMMANVMGYDEFHLTEDRDAPMGVLNRVGSPDRFFEYYEPKITLEEGVYRALWGHK